MKIMFYISAIFYGGAARVMSNIANTLAEKGHNCILVTTFKVDDEYELSNKVKRIYFYNSNPRGNFLMKNIAITRNLRKQVLSENPDVLVSFLGEPNYRAALATIGTKTKTILSVRNDPSKEYPGFFRTLLAKILFRRVDGMVFQTNDARSWFPKSIQKKSRVIFNPVKQDFYDTVLSENGIGIIATGRLCKQKNHAMLIEAFSKIADKVFDDLYIYGAGDSTQLRNLAMKLGVSERVHLPGQVRNIKDVLKSAKIYVMSSDFEGMPNALMEAMAMGLPCVSTDCPCGGPKVLFSDSMHYFLTPVGDTDSFSSKMLELLSDDKKRLDHGNNCRKAAKAFYPEIIYNQWEDYMASVIRG